MSVTTLLVPVDEAEAEALLEQGAQAELLPSIIERAGVLRARVERVDAVREELHAALFDRWEGAHAKPKSAFVQVLEALRKKRKPAEPSTGYDPFVHLFGRSLPLDAPAAQALAESLANALKVDETAFAEAVAESLKRLDPKAEAIWRGTPSTQVPEGVGEAIRAEAARAKLSDPTESLRPALNAIARLSAWSRPVWRLDGELLSDLVETLGVEVPLGSAKGLFEVAAETRAWMQGPMEALPTSLPDFHGAGGAWSSAEVKLLAGALRLRRGRIAENVAGTESPMLTMRHARLLEEAAAYCAAEGFALVEAAGIEWHDRR